FALLGLPGVLFYRAVNTLDAMIGYRGRYEHLGKASARLDDLLNLVPARLTALLLLLVSPFVRPSGRSERASVVLLRGLRALWRAGSSTSSPNAGRPMATAAGLLDVTLAKEGEYRLHATGGAATASSIRAAARLVRAAAFAGVLCAIALIEVLHG